jgi:lysophospholipase L1-like esterase
MRMCWRWAPLASMVVGLALALTASGRPWTTVYLALGDSVAAGDGASRPEHSYVGLELARLRQHAPGDVRLALYAAGGATSEGLARWQAPAAADELAAMRRGERPGLRPGPITITVGGNDLLHLGGRAALTGVAPDEAAVRDAIARVERNVDAAVAALLEAAGPAGRVTLTTYYDPFSARPGAGPGRGLAFDAVVELNRALLRVAERHPDQVRVARIDQALPRDATIAQYLADPIHPNDRGHATIAREIARAWGG